MKNKFIKKPPLREVTDAVIRYKIYRGSATPTNLLLDNSALIRRRTDSVIKFLYARGTTYIGIGDHLLSSSNAEVVAHPKFWSG